MLMMDAIRRKHRRAWLALVARGILALAVGVFILLRPVDSLAAVALCIAIWAILSGITEVTHALETRSTVGSWWWVLLAGGLISIGFGVAAIYYFPALSLAFLTLWVAVSLATSGIVLIFSSIQMRQAGVSWVWASIWGVSSVLTSVIAFINPPATIAAVLSLLAAFSIVSGSAMLIAAWHIRAFTKHLAAALHPTSIS
jgi:uncharacterized membrane protein HdeD (DUF308 family)